MSGSILKLATSRGVVIVISFVTAPILGRLFPPHAYGALGVLGTVLSIIASFATLSFVSAIPLAASPVERRNLFVLCSIIGLLSTVVVTVGSLMGAEYLASVFHEPAVARYALFLPLLFLAAAVRQIFDTTLSSQKRFGAVAVRNVLEITVTRLSQLGLCLFGLLGSPLALILGSLAGSVAAAFTAGATSIRDVFRIGQGPLQLGDLRAVAVKHRKFPLVHLWSVTLNALTLGIPAIVLGTRYSVEAVGLYTMAHSMATLPLHLFIGGAAQVFYVEAGERVAHDQSVAPPTMHLVRLITTLTSLPLVAILILGPLIFEVFLGPKWQEAGVYAQVLVPWMALTAISGPLSAVYAVLSRQGEGFFWNIVLLVGRFSALYFGGLFFGVRITLGLFVAVSVAIIAGLMWRSLFLLGVSRRWVAVTMVRAYVAPLLFLVPAGILFWVFHARVAALVALALACAAYAMVVYMRHPEMIRPLLARLPHRLGSRRPPPSRPETWS